MRFNTAVTLYTVENNTGALKILEGKIYLPGGQIISDIRFNFTFNDCILASWFE